MQYQTFLSKRYLKRRWAPWAAALAVALGVFSLISVLAVMEGFKLEMKERIRGSLSHVVVKGSAMRMLVGEDPLLEAARETAGVEAASPFIETLAIYRSTVLDYCILRGIDPSSEPKVSDFGLYLLSDEEIDRLQADRFLMLPDDRPPPDPQRVSEMFSLERRRQMLRWRLRGDPSVGFDEQAPPQGLVVGIEALRSGRLALGDVVQLSSYSPVSYEPRIGQFIVVGAFQSGVYEQDQRWAYSDIRALQQILDLWDDEAQDMRITGISLRLSDYSQANQIREQVQQEIGRRMELDPTDGDAIPWRSMEIKTWEEQRENLLQAVEIEKRIIAAMMLLIVAFAAAMIFLILMLLVIEKNRDLGVLRALGATRSGVVILVLKQGMFLCITGAVFGLLGGWLLIENINQIHELLYLATGVRLFPPDIYYLEKIPAHLRWQDMVLVCAPTLIFGFLGSLLPALWAGRRDPIKALHHE
ncbi:MAG: ABC transporter permease [Planctomycetota bacterium]|nr:ABC transporter permease [Planctomycetota bacterium]